MTKFRSVAKNGFSFLLGSTILTFTALAAPSVATVTSAVPFTLDGHYLSSPGVTSFPLVAGDTVATSDGSAVLLFNDGSTVKLSEASSIKLNTVGANTNVVLLSGNLDYKLAAGSNIKVTSVDTAAQQTVTSDASPTSRRSVASVLSSKAFLVSAGSGATGVASALLASSFSSSAASTSTTAATSTMSAKTATSVVTTLCITPPKTPVVPVVPKTPVCPPTPVVPPTPVCPLPPVSKCY